jgi:hypothetical protein
MPLIPLVLAGGLTAASDVYFPVAGSVALATNETNEGRAQLTADVDAYYSKLYVSVIANASTGTSTVHFRINGANGNQSVSFATTAVGVFQDLTNSDFVAAGDEIGIQLDRGGGGNVNLGVIASYANPGRFYSQVGGFGSANFSAASTTTECSELSVFRSSGVGDNGRIRVRTPFTAKNMQVNISVNGKSTTTTVQMKKTGANAAPNVAVGSGVVGIVRDLSNSESYASGDTLYYEVITGTGTGNFTVTCCSRGTEWANKAVQLSWLMVTGIANNGTGDSFLPFGGNQTNLGTESSVEIPLYGSGTVDLFQVRISANAVAAAGVQFIVRKNGADTTLKNVITGTGTFLDSTNSFTFVDGDKICLKYTRPTAATGSITYRWFSVVVTYNTGVSETIIF